jgi:penicillin-binding protein 1C
LIIGATLLVAFGALFAIDRAFPPPDPHDIAVSPEAVDRHGELLRAFTIPAGTWRLKAKLEMIDPKLRRMTIAYEDKRFAYHPGIDPLALARAARQFLRTGRIVSGGSTLSMQLARLLEPRRERSLTAKFKQMARAVQLDWRHSKDDILGWYLTLAPYGGNLEGVRAAALAYFGKEPRALTVAEAALLVALPQLPELRRPDRQQRSARAARDNVLARMVEAGVITREEAAMARRQAIPQARHELPALAAHVSARALQQGADRAELTIDRVTQSRAEAILRESAKSFGPRLSLALLVADHRTGEILARAGSPDPFDHGRRGFIDMTRAKRSPGSALKPFIYGLAFEHGIAHPDTLIEDRPETFAGYRPGNFTHEFLGTVSLREALQLSLNLPAVKLLEAAGPLRLAAAFRQAGISMKLPKGASPTLAVALGGVGLSLEEVVTLYSAFPRGGSPARLHETASSGSKAREADGSAALFGPLASWHVGDILRGTPTPDQAKSLGIAYKTGTSYGNRDAWAIGFNERFVVGIWAGRADGTAVADLTGRKYAAPVLFRMFEALGNN